MFCKYCSSNQFIKNGFYKNNQRFKCKSCSKIFTYTTRKYTSHFKMRCIELCLRGMSIRQASEYKKIHNSLLSYWLKKSAQITQELIKKEAEKIKDKTDIELVEIDELCTYVKKTSTT